MRFALAVFGGIAPWLLPAAVAAGSIPDAPFWQDVAVRIDHAPELANALFKKLCVDKENTVYVLTDKGVARVFDDTLALDKSYRPLAGKIARDIALTPQGELAYLFDDGWLANDPDGHRRPSLEPSAANRSPLLKAPPGAPWPEVTSRTAVPGGAWYGT